MTDADRMREAASRLDALVRNAGDNPGVPAWAEQNAAAAAVLRAVAVEAEVFLEKRVTPVPAHWDSLTRVVVPVRDLADAILGDTDD